MCAEKWSVLAFATFKEVQLSSKGLAMAHDILLRPKIEHQDRLEGEGNLCRRHDAGVFEVRGCFGEVKMQRQTAFKGVHEYHQ